MITRIIGDTHGLWEDYHRVASGAERSVQVGDFGIGFSQGDYWHERADVFASRGHRFIRGNHDNPAKCAEMRGWIPDGHVENDVMYLGGAWSIDRAWRTEGKSWWADEQLSQAQLDYQLGVYDMVRPSVMVTHDAPEEAVREMFGVGTHKPLYPTRTGQALQAMFELHQPRWWFFGHWHVTQSKLIRGTQFYCLDELDYVDFDLDKKEVVG